MKDTVIHKAHQVWYMNADTLFMVKGDELSTWGEEIYGKVKLGNAEIKKALQKR